MLVEPEMPVVPEVPLAVPPVLELVPAVLEVPPALESSPESLLHAASALAETNVAPNANVAARPSRVRGSCGSGVPARSSGSAQNGHSFSDTRT